MNQSKHVIVMVKIISMQFIAINQRRWFQTFHQISSFNFLLPQTVHDEIFEGTRIQIETHPLKKQESDKNEFRTPEKPIRDIL